MLYLGIEHSCSLPMTAAGPLPEQMIYPSPRLGSSFPGAALCLLPAAAPPETIN